MTRNIVLTALLITGALSLAVSAYQQPAGGRQGGGQQAAPSAAALQVDKVKDNLYVLRGGGGNTAVFIGANGVTIVDTKLPGWGPAILDRIKTLTDKPVVRIINTHTHFDHVSGNVAFPATVDVVTQENTKTFMQAANPVYGLQTGPQENLFTENGGRGLPTHTFKDRMTIGAGADRIDLHYFGCAHTGGDAWVMFTGLRTMHVGDVFASKDLPIMDRNNGGCGIAYAATIMKGASSITNVDTIITGHSNATMTMADLRQYGEFVRDFASDVQAAKKAGKSVDDVARAWKPAAKYAGYTTPQAARIKADAQVVWDEIK
jgi:glyoxylase-like metal-dependent hydrolase (beta-lactamase superfamily II)